MLEPLWKLMANCQHLTPLLVRAEVQTSNRARGEFGLTQELRPKLLLTGHSLK